MSREQQRTRKNQKKRKRTILIGFLFIICITGVGFFVKEKQKPENHGLQTTSSKTVAASKKTTQTEEKKETKRTASETFLKQVDLQSWQLQLVGPDYKIAAPIDEATTLENVGSFQMNKAIVTSFEELEAAAQAAGYPLVIVSAYRSVAYQEQVLNAAIQQKMANGMTYDEALADAKKTMTEPGYSEHHTGLAIDVVDQYWYNNYTPELLHSNFGQTEGGKWLAANVANYGFIIRYPEGKEALTKIEYEPWHIRYVGKENATYMTKHQLTLEEFLEKAKKEQQK